jgi:hypothetical protein
MFAHLARQTFGRSPEGDDLYFPFAWASQPRVVSTVEERGQILDRQVKFMCIQFLTTILFLLALNPSLRRLPESEGVILLSGALVCLFLYMVHWLLFRTVATELPVYEGPAGLKFYCQSTAHHYGSYGLGLRIALSFVFSVASAWVIFGLRAYILGGFSMAFAFLCLLLWLCAWHGPRPTVRHPSPTGSQKCPSQR